MHSAVPADTEMEAEVEPSLETEQRLRAEAAEAKRREGELERITAAALAQRQAAELEAAEEARQQDAQAAEEAANRERIRQVSEQGALNHSGHLKLRTPSKTSGRTNQYLQRKYQCWCW
jgi:hypothetical protein